MQGSAIALMLSIATTTADDEAFATTSVQLRCDVSIATRDVDVLSAKLRRRQGAKQLQTAAPDLKPEIAVGLGRPLDQLRS